MVGFVKKVVHLSQATYVPSTRLVPGRNDKGYGWITGDDGSDVFFPHDVVEGYRGFDRLRKGQRVEYTLESGPFNYAERVTPITEAVVRLLPAA